MKRVIFLSLLVFLPFCLQAQLTFEIRCICSPDQATGGIVVETEGAFSEAAFAWSGPSGYFSAEQSIFGLEEVGLYELEVTLPDGEILHFQQEVDYCFEVEAEVKGGTGGAGFTIAVQVKGTGPFTYAWYKFEGNEFVPMGVEESLIGGLVPAYYSVEIHQQNTGCRVFESFTLESDGQFLLSPAVPEVGTGLWRFRFCAEEAGEGQLLLRRTGGEVVWQESLLLDAGLQEKAVKLSAEHLSTCHSLEIRQGESLLLAVPHRP